MHSKFIGEQSFFKGMLMSELNQRGVVAIAQNLERGQMQFFFFLIKKVKISLKLTLFGIPCQFN